MRIIRIKRPAALRAAMLSEVRQRVVTGLAAHPSKDLLRRLGNPVPCQIEQENRQDSERPDVQRQVKPGVLSEIIRSEPQAKQ